MNYPIGSVYRGLDALKAYLRQSCDGWEEGAFEPECFLHVGEKIVIRVCAGIRCTVSKVWSESWPADVWTFHNDRATYLREFAHREDSLRWAGIDAKANEHLLRVSKIMK